MSLCLHSLITGVVLSILVTSSDAQSQTIKGTYKNYAEGFAVTIPLPLEGVAGNEAGPERGVRISTPNGGAISVWGEPNSHEWKTPEDGIKWVFENMEECSSSSANYTIAPARIGRMTGAEGRSQCGNQVVMYILAFRPEGGPIYWLHLETTAGKEAEEVLVIRRIASNFKLIAWK